MTSKLPPTLDDLQGEWRIVSVGENGGKAPFFVPWLLKPRLLVEGDRYTKFVGTDMVEKGRLTITPASEYSNMDEHVESGDDRGKQHLGIVRWVGNKLEHLQGKIGHQRPKGFPYQKGSTVGYAKMKRK